MKKSGTFSALLTWLVQATAIIRSVQSEQWNDAARCSLNCLNGGTCIFTSASEQDFHMSMQSGQMVQQCACTGAYTGTGCEIPVSQCQFPKRICPNGIPCQKKQSQLSSERGYTCDCSEALKVSPFAGLMCKSPFTEYCDTGDVSSGTLHNRVRDMPPVLFCTNGGKCKSTILAAEYAPGNTSANAIFANKGCVCPLEFYGPHCEFLRYGGALEAASGADPMVASHNAQTSNPSEAPTQDTATAGPSPAPTHMVPDGFWEPKTPGPVNGQGGQPAAATPVNSSQEAGSGHSKKKIVLPIVMAVMGCIALFAGVMCYLQYRRIKTPSKSVVVAAAIPRPTYLKTVRRPAHDIDKRGVGTKSWGFFRSNAERQPAAERGLGIPPPPSPYLVGDEDIDDNDDDNNTHNNTDDGEEEIVIPTGYYHYRKSSRGLDPISWESQFFYFT